MKVLLINNCHYPRGGADIVYLNTGKLLENKGHEVIYFSTNNPQHNNHKINKYFVNGINFFELSLFKKVINLPRFFYSIESKKKLEQLIDDYRPDIAHIHLYKGGLTSSILKALKKKKVPTVFSIHDYGLLCPHNLLLDGKNEICTRCITRPVLSCIKHKCNRNNLILSSISAAEHIFHSTFIPFNKYFTTILAVSKFSQNLHNSSGKLSKPILHLYNFYPDLEQTKPDIDKGKYFLFFGRLSKEKGVSTLIEAWDSVKRKTVLKIAGTGEQYNELVNYSKSANIEFLGFKSGDELNDLIRKASFIIVPSEWYENNPMTIIEAYANGKPVIGSNIGGIPEIIVENETGFLFEMKNVKALSDVISKAENVNESDYFVLSRNARDFAEKNFSEKTHYNSLLDIYNLTIQKMNKTK